MERMSDEEAKLAERIGRANAWGREMRLAVLDDWAVARRAEKEKDEEIERLRKEVEERLGEMNLQAMWTLQAQQESARKDAVIKAMADALDGAMQVAFWGPRDEKGGPGGETVYQWRERVRQQGEDALARVGRLK